VPLPLTPARARILPVSHSVRCPTQFRYVLGFMSN